MLGKSQRPRKIHVWRINKNSSFYLHFFFKAVTFESREVNEYSIESSTGVCLLACNTSVFGGSVSFVRIFFFPIRRDRVISCWNSFRQLAISRLMFLRLENSFFPLWNCRDQHRLMHLQTHVWSSNISLFLWKQEKFHHCKNFWQTHRLSWQKLVQKKKKKLFAFLWVWPTETSHVLWIYRTVYQQS